MYTYASRGKRFVAYLIDTIIVGLIVGFIFWSIGFDKVFNDYISSSTDITDKLEFIEWRNNIRNCSFGLYCVYCCIMEATSWQATLGKKIMGIRVIKTDGEDLNIVTSILRNAFKIVSSIPCALGFIWILFSSERKGWHDYVANTVVIED